MTLKTVTSGKGNIPSPRMHSFEDAKLQAGKKATGVRSGRDVDVSDREQHSQEESYATTGKEPKTSKQGNSVHSGPNKKITDRVKDGPFSNQTGNNSNAKIRQTWQLERSLQHQDRPFSQASNACQKEGANRVQGSNRQGTRLLDRRGNHHGAG